MKISPIKKFFESFFKKKLPGQFSGVIGNLTRDPALIENTVSVVYLLQILRSVDVKVEASILTDCSITKITTYQWTVRNATSGAIIVFPNLLPSTFQGRILILPRRTLSYGNISVELQVRVSHITGL